MYKIIFTLVLYYFEVSLLIAAVETSKRDGARFFGHFTYLCNGIRLKLRMLAKGDCCRQSMQPLEVGIGNVRKSGSRVH